MQCNNYNPHYFKYDIKYYDMSNLKFIDNKEFQW